MQLHLVTLEEQWEEEGGLDEEDEKEEEERHQHEKEMDEKKVDGENDENMDVDADKKEEENEELYEETEWDLEAARVFWRTFRDVGEGLKDGVDNSLAPATLGGFADVRCGVNWAI